MVKNLPANAGDEGDTGSTPGLGRSPREGSGNLLQYSYLGNPMHRGTWWAALLGSPWTCEAVAAAKSLQLCLTLQPYRWQPTRLLCPWDSPGKNTGMGCHFLFQCMKVKRESRSVLSDSSRPHGLQPTKLLCPWDFPGKSTGVGCHSGYLLNIP